MKDSCVSLNPPDNNRSSAPIGVLVPAVAALLCVQVWLLWSGGGPIGPILTPSGGWWLVAQLWALAASAYLLWKLALVANYRPCPDIDDDALPSVTVIVPAYNESRQVYGTIVSLVRSRYPADKLRVVAVNDGSRDDTWVWMEKARAAYPVRVVTVDCRVNRGKRHALYEGFARARGSVIVTVDGDSEVLPDTLRNLVSPLVVDRRVGAVAGNVRVLNRHQGILPRMLDVAFTYAFEFMRASESEVDSVQCCPGALSAYRRSMVRAHQDAWLAQRFMGRPANIGEDRAMTNLILRSGGLVRFQSNAVVLTEVPTGLNALCRMFLRWARSNVRESLVLIGFVFSRFRAESMAGARVNATWALVRMVVGAVLFVPGILAVLRWPSLALWLVGGAALSALFPAVVYAVTRTSAMPTTPEERWSKVLLGAVWAFPYAWLSTFALSWIAPYALVTVGRSGWLTRGLSAPADLPALPAPQEHTTTLPLRAAR